MKTRQDNDVIDHIGLVYIKIETELSRPIELGAVCDETRQDSDVTDLIGTVYAENNTGLSWPIEPCLVFDENRTMTWLIVHVQFTLKMILSYRDCSNQVQFVTKTRQDNDVIDYISVIYVEIETEL